MSVKALSSVWNNSRQKGGALLVLLALADFADDDGVSWASITKIATKSRLTTRQVQRTIRDLATAGEIAVELRERINGSSTSNLYRVLSPPPDIMSPPQGDKMSEGDAHVTPGGDAGVRGRVTPMSPLDPSVEPSDEPPLLSPEPAEPASVLVLDEVVMIFPVVGKTSEWHLFKSKVDEYQATFPGTNVPQLLREARQWCIDHPTRRKTEAGMTNYLFGWIERNQNRGRTRNEPKSEGAKRTMPNEPFNWRELIRIHYADSLLAHDANSGRDWADFPRNAQQSIIEAVERIPYEQRRSA